MKLESDAVFDQWLKDLRSSEDVDASIVIIRDEIRVYDDALGDEIRVESCSDRDDKKIQTLCLRASRLTHLLKILEWRVEQRDRDYLKQKPKSVSKSPKAAIMSAERFEEIIEQWRLKQDRESIESRLDYYESERLRLANLDVNASNFGDIGLEIEKLDFRIKELHGVLDGFDNPSVGEESDLDDQAEDADGAADRAIKGLAEASKIVSGKMGEVGEVIDDATLTVLKGDMESLADASHLLGGVVSNMRVITVAKGDEYTRKDMRISDIDGSHLMTAFVLVEQVIRHSGLKR